MGIALGQAFSLPSSMWRSKNRWPNTGLFDPFPQAGPPSQGDMVLLSLGSLALRDGQQFLKIHAIFVAA